MEHSGSSVQDNKDKEGAFEITHVAKRVNFELAQKLQKSLYYVKARNILNLFEIKYGELGKSALMILARLEKSHRVVTMIILQIQIRMFKYKCFKYKY